MKRLALTALLAAAALAAACGRSPAAPETRQAPARALHDGYLGSGNHHDTTTAVGP
jgi:ABC-type phosphate/phosphonate transport system substrate-binding protein